MPLHGTSAEIRSRSPAQTGAIGEALGRILRDTGAAGTVIALLGPLGAGKTCLVQGLARGLGVSGYVRSPTFTLIHEYPGPVPLYHVDLYRIEPSDLDGLGLDEIVDGPGLTVIEWAERAGPVLPKEYLQVELEFGTSEEERVLRLRPRGGRYRGVVEAVQRCASSL